MKKILIIIVMSVLLSLGLNAFAAGDLTVTGNATVNGTFNVGTGGIKFSDGSTQTTAIPHNNTTVVYKSASQSAPANSGNTMISFDSEVYDNHGVHDNVINNQRLTIPTGFNFAVIECFVRIGHSNGVDADIILVKNSGYFVTPNVSAIYRAGSATSPTSATLTFRSYPIPVVAGDYFRVLVDNYDATTGLAIDNNGTWCTVDLKQ